MVTFHFNQFGENLGTRQLGLKVKEQLWPLVFDADKVELNFDGVNVVSNSFADECIAKLLLEMTHNQLKQKTTFTGLNVFARQNIVIALRRRLHQCSKEEVN
ncbi:MAG: STAS-like domain-containing protein [Muribaculaceae bacterium]|nr:STAS-like domain-containing protein [Muribaculaceae bacterium]